MASRIYWTFPSQARGRSSWHRCRNKNFDFSVPFTFISTTTFDDSKKHNTFHEYFLLAIVLSLHAMLLLNTFLSTEWMKYNYCLYSKASCWSWELRLKPHYIWVTHDSPYRIPTRYRNPTPTGGQKSIFEMEKCTLIYSRTIIDKANRWIKSLRYLIDGGWYKRDQKSFWNSIKGGLDGQGVGNQPLKWKNLLWFTAELSLIRSIDE